MSDCTIIKNKAVFETTVETFLDKMFKPALENNLGDIEIRTSQMDSGRSNIFATP